MKSPWYFSYISVWKLIDTKYPKQQEWKHTSQQNSLMIRIENLNHTIIDYNTSKVWIKSINYENKKIYNYLLSNTLLNINYQVVIIKC